GGPLRDVGHHGVDVGHRGRDQPRGTGQVGALEGGTMAHPAPVLRSIAVGPAAGSATRSARSANRARTTRSRSAAPCRRNVSLTDAITVRPTPARRSGRTSVSG